MDQSWGVLVGYVCLSIGESPGNRSQNRDRYHTGPSRLHVYD